MQDLSIQLAKIAQYLLENTSKIGRIHCKSKWYWNHKKDWRNRIRYRHSWPCLSGR